MSVVTRWLMFASRRQAEAERRVREGLPEITDEFVWGVYARVDARAAGWLRDIQRREAILRRALGPFGAIDPDRAELIEEQFAADHTGAADNPEESA
jgi:hypothetical protein